MTTQSTTAKKSPRRWFAPRFSLRMLMVLMTALAISSGVWWRWPIQRTQQTKLRHHIPGVNTTIYGNETITYHRGWNGSLIQHGRRTLTYHGDLYEEEMFREGVRHGPARYPHGRGIPEDPNDHGPADSRSAVGEFFLGKRHGTWEFLGSWDFLPAGWQSTSPSKCYRSLENWNRGQRQGVFEWFDETGKSCYRHEFKNDLLIDPQNNPTGNLLLKRIAAGQLTDPLIVHKLFASTNLVASTTELKMVLDDFKDRHNLLLAARFGRGTSMPGGEPVMIYDVPVSAKEANLPLVGAFDRLLSPLRLVLDYRFGVLCILDADGAEDWRDTTGVMELHPAKDTLLAFRLDSPPKPTCLEPLRDVLRNLAADQELQVAFRPANDPNLVLRSIPEDEMVGLFREVLTIRNSPQSAPPEPLPITLRQLLGLILDQANLHCHEENGVLIIEQLQKVAPTQTDNLTP